MNILDPTFSENTLFSSSPRETSFYQIFGQHSLRQVHVLSATEKEISNVYTADLDLHTRLDRPACSAYLEIYRQGKGAARFIYVQCSALHNICVKQQDL